MWLPQSSAFNQSTITASVTASGITVDRSGNVYLVDRLNHQILKASPSLGTYTQTVVATGIENPVGSGFRWQREHLYRKRHFSGAYVQSVVAVGLQQPLGVTQEPQPVRARPGIFAIAARKARGRLLLRVIALSSDFSKTWFGFQAATRLSQLPERPAGLRPCFPRSAAITFVARASSDPSPEPPVSRSPRANSPVSRFVFESRCRASRFFRVYSLPLEDLSSVELIVIAKPNKSSGCYEFSGVEIEGELWKYS